MPLIDEKGTHVTIRDFMNIEGMGIAKASALVSAFEFVRRRIKPEGLKIKKPADILQLIQHYSDRTQEHFLSISVSSTIIPPEMLSPARKIFQSPRKLKLRPNY